MLCAAGRRFLTLLLPFVVGTAVVSLALGLVLGLSVARSISLGFYIAGSFVMVSGFFMGNRGPARLKGPVGDEGPWGISPRRRLRWASAEEREAALSDSAVFVTIGLVLIVIGVVADTRYTLY